MAGLYIKELLLRDDVKRCLIVAPGGLVEQWHCMRRHAGEALQERLGAVQAGSARPARGATALRLRLGSPGSPFGDSAGGQNNVTIGHVDLGGS